MTRACVPHASSVMEATFCQCFHDDGWKSHNGHQRQKIQLAGSNVSLPSPTSAWRTMRLMNICGSAVKEPTPSKGKKYQNEGFFFLPPQHSDSQINIKKILSSVFIGIICRPEPHNREANPRTTIRLHCLVQKFNQLIQFFG